MAAEPTVDDLLERAEYFAAALDFEQSAYYYGQVLGQLREERPDVWEDFAGVLLEVGRNEDAFALLQRCVEVAPASGFTKYMSLGQMLAGEEALQCFGRGIELMEKEKSRLQRGGKLQEAREVQAQLAAAYVAAAEIYMTDCCFADNAEATVDQFLANAVKCDSQSPEPYLALASFRLSQSRPQDAMQALEKSYMLWKDCAPDERPPFDFRKSTAKIMIEVQQYDPAVDVLDTLLEEDDDVFEVWYLRGLATYFLKDAQASLSDFSQAVAVYTKHDLADDPQAAEVLAHITALTTEMQSALTSGSS